LFVVAVPNADAVAPSADVRVTGIVTTPAAAGELEVDYTVTVAGSAVDGVVLTSAQPDAATADPSSVEVNGVPADPATVTAAADTLVVRLGSGADATDGGTLAVGAYLVSMDVADPATLPVTSTVSAEVDYTRAGVPGSATSAPVALGEPDLVASLPAWAGETGTLPLGTGNIGDFAVGVTNRGADSTGGTLTITLPAGLTVDLAAAVLRGEGSTPDALLFGGQPLTCSSAAATVTCAVGALAHSEHIVLDIPLKAVAGPAPESTGTFRAAVVPDDLPDSNPADNGISARFRFTGIAQLHVRAVPAEHRVRVGRSVTVRLSVTNNGPQPARQTIGVVLSGSAKHFAITSFSGRKLGAEGGLLPDDPKRSAVWNIGTLASGHTITARLVLKARSKGKVRILFSGASVAGDPKCATVASRGCQENSVVALTAVPAPKHASKHSKHSAKHSTHSATTSARRVRTAR